MDQQMGGMSSDLSPKSIGDILGAVFDTYKKHWQTLMTIVAIFAIPVQIIQFYVVDQLILKPLNTAALSDVQSLSDLNEAVGGTFYRSLWAFGVGNLIITVLSFVLMAAITKAAADDIVGATPSVGDSYSFGFSKFLSVIWVSILAGLIVVGGLFLFVIPGLIFAVKLAVSIPALVVEDKRGSQAIGRSWKLTSGVFWHVLGAILVAAILTSFVSGIISGPFTNWFMKGIFSGIAMTITMPFSTLVSVILYVDLRVRKENLSTDRLRQELARAGGSA